MHLHRITFIVATAVMAVASNSFGAVVAGPVVNPANGHTYYLVTQNTWTASEAEAVGLGGHLVTINDSAENDWVFSNFASFNDQHYLWTGLNDAGHTGTFTWVSGEPLGYTKWGINQPDNPGVEHYVELSAPQFDGAGFWNNYVDSNNEFGVPIDGVVEMVPEPTSLALIGGAALLSLRRRRGHAG